MTLSITITLTIMSMMNSVTKEAPRTSYLKALDIWLVVCFVFTFLVLVQYCLVLYLSKTNDWYVCMYVCMYVCCLLYTSPSPRDRQKSRMPSSA